MSILPRLPVIEDLDLLLEICTHKGLKPTWPGETCKWGDPGRLAELGAQLLNQAVTFHFFSLRPLVRSEEIRVGIFCLPRRFL